MDLITNMQKQVHTPLRGLALAAESECDLAEGLWVDQPDPLHSGDTASCCMTYLPYDGNKHDKL